MYLSEFLSEFYDAHGLRTIASKMGLSGAGQKSEVAERISRAFVEWTPDCEVGDTLHQFSARLRRTQLKQVSARLTSNIEGSDQFLFDSVARKIPEMASRGEDWLFPPHLRFVLMACYSRRGLQRIAKELDLDWSGTPYALSERISRCAETLVREEDAHRILVRLRKEADEEGLRSVCAQLGIPADGGKKNLFKRLSTQILELDRITKPNYFKKLEAKTRGETPTEAESSIQVSSDEGYSR